MREILSNHWRRIFGAYLLAAMVAGFVKILPQGGYHSLVEGIGVSLAVSLLVAILVLPVWLPTVYHTEKRRKIGMHWFVAPAMIAAGLGEAAIQVLAAPPFADLRDSLRETELFAGESRVRLSSFLLSLFSGFIGGLVYWWFAGRHAGQLQGQLLKISVPAPRPFLLHLLFMLLGYALAVLVSVTIAVLIMGLPTVLPDQGNWGSFYSFWRDFPGLFLGGLTITALYALPGWLISVVIAEARRDQRRYWFAAAGVLTALLALIFAGMGRGLLSMPAMLFGSLTGGFFGGLVYWAVIGKRSGQWRSAPAPSIQSDPVSEGALK
jgi:hypothetical protein